MNRERKQVKLFNEFLITWLDEVKLMHAPSTYVKYFRLARNHIIPYFCGVTLGEITRGRLNEFWDYLRGSDIASTDKKRSEGTIRCVIMIVNLVIKEAFGRGLISEVITVTPGFRKRKTIVQVFSVEEQKVLERYLKSNWNYASVGIYLCLYTGLRLGEICALKWENVNVRDGYLHVKYTVQRLCTDENEEVKGKKTSLILTPPESSSFV